MFHRIHDKMGTAGLIVACIALVFAMLGGAYAATTSSRKHKRGGLSAAQKKLIQKEAKKWGQKYAKTGPAGADGAQGAKGDKGDAGAAGVGSNGADGADGNTILSGAGTPVDVDGVDGDFYIDTTAPAMYGPKGAVLADSWVGTGPTDLKGEDGEDGEDGEPWVAGQAPVGATFRGVWAISGTATASGETFLAPLSTGVPIPPGSGTVIGTIVSAKIMPVGAVANPSDTGGCTGTVADPTLEPTANQFTLTSLKAAYCLYPEVGTNIDTGASGKLANGPLSSIRGGGTIAQLKSLDPDGVDPSAFPVSGYGVWVMKVIHE